MRFASHAQTARRLPTRETCIGVSDLGIIKRVRPVLTTTAQFLMCVTSDKLIGGECCHCHFRSAHYPVCSHRAGGSVSRKKHSSSSTSTKTPDEVAIESQHALEEVKKEEAISVRGSPSTRKVKVDARSEIRRMSAWSIFSGDEEEAEQSDSISWC